MSLCDESLGWSYCVSSGRFIHRKASLHPAMLALGIVRYVLVTHRRQFTGGVCAGVSMCVRAVGNDLGVFIGQQLRGEFLDRFGWDVQLSGDVRFAIALGERLDDRDLFPVELGFQVFCGNCGRCPSSLTSTY